jgi:hypothetical protein
MLAQPSLSLVRLDIPLNDGGLRRSMLKSPATEHFKKTLLIKADFQKARLALKKLQAFF